MKYFTIEEFCLFGGWTNTWYWEDDKGDTIPMIYESKKEAKDELNRFFKECNTEFVKGNIEDKPVKHDYRIVEVKHEKL